MNMTDYLAMFGSPRVSDMDIQSMLNTLSSLPSARATLVPPARANYGLVQTPMFPDTETFTDTGRQSIGETRGYADEIQPTPPIYELSGQPTPPMQQIRPLQQMRPMGTPGVSAAATGVVPTVSEELMQRTQQTPMVQGVDALVKQVADTINRGEPITQAQKDVIRAALEELGVSVKDFNRAVGNLIVTQQAMELQELENPEMDFSIRPTSAELGSVVDVDTTGMSPGALGGALDSAEEFPGFAGGGYVGRGTMAGELAPRGSMSVREAGETMFERMKRMRGYAGGGPVDHSPSSGVRRTMANALSPNMQRRIFG
tara:strand:+ start:716 stop:1660 length:945 start_codon:yes stop_codon:yes gene_type:complete